MQKFSKLTNLFSIFACVLMFTGCGKFLKNQTVSPSSESSSSSSSGVELIGATSLFAGSGVSGSSDGTGAAATLSNPYAMVADSAGNIYFTEYGYGVVRKITPAGVVTTIAGTAGSHGTADGTGAAASFGFITGIAIDGSGDLYVADTQGTLRKVTPAGVVTTIAGTAGVYGGADGTGAAASFSGGLEGLAVDSAGNIFVADAGNSTIRMVTPGGVVTTFAGAAGFSGTADGTGAAARFSNFIVGIAIDANDTVYVADYGNSTIRKITPAGVVTTFAGTAGVAGSVDGTGTAARFFSPTYIAIDSTGDLYMTDQYTVRKVTSAGEVTTFVGTHGVSGSTEGTGAAASFGQAWSLAIGADGTLFVGDDINHNIRQIQ